MWSNRENNFPARGFSTPPASWKLPHCPVVMQLSERKSVSSGCRRDLFHVIHKVPAGDSPYVRAKHVQLVEKDPSRAISLFWAAINVGDRIDSALKDMAVVMKQLNRSDEAIEAIKSFRHLCPYDSQESLDNVLVELYKRSGRIDEEIEMLHRKLKNIEEGIAFGGKRTKIARSQGKKIQITIEQERSRILGNLAWAYLQHHDYGLAEQHYRKALSLEPDKNKQCNLAICLMHMNRFPEAKSLLQAVSDSCGHKQMDDSYAKSFERAVEMLTELESKSVLKPIGEDKLKEVVNSTEGGRGNVSGSMDSRRWADGQNKEPVLSDKHIRGSDCASHSENQGNFACSLSSQQNGVDNYWRKGLCFENPGERSTFSSKMKENRIGSTGKGLASANKLMLDSPAAVLYTQPKRVSWRFGEGGQRRVGWEEDSVEKPYKHVSHSVRKPDGGLLDSTDENSEAELSKSQSRFLSPTERNWRERSWTEVAQGKSTGAAVLLQFSQPRIKSDSQQASCGRNARESGDWTRCTKEDSNICPKYHLEQTIVVDDPRQSEASIDGKWGQSFGINVSGKLMVSTDNVGDRCLGKNSSSNKSWADKVEEEQKILVGKDLSRCFDDAWNYEEESNDENQDSNTIHGSTCPKSPVEAINQKFEAFDLRDGYDTFINAVSPRNPTVRRSLCFDAKNDLNMRKKNRLQVFQDITPSPDSP